MAFQIDDMDRKILVALQEDAGRSLDEIARAVGSSKTPVWNRIRKLKEAGVIGRQTAILDPEALGLEACFFVLIRTSDARAPRGDAWNLPDSSCRWIGVPRTSKRRLAISALCTSFCEENDRASQKLSRNISS